MPDDSRSRERDLILAPNEYAFLLDETKGNVIDYVGPNKTSLANTDQPVAFNNGTKRFEPCNLERSIRLFSIAPEGWYLVLKNPAQDSKNPTPGTANSLPELNVGRKVNIPGPTSFALWPGQMVRVLQGHHLRSNQYLVVRIYDEEAARENWAKAVIKPQTTAGSDPDGGEDAEGSRQAEVNLDVDLTMGNLLVIKGTDVSFYIPPTGVEVVPESSRRYVRDAVTLERLEYCILLDEDGNKRYIQGPAVVFPRPTEDFVAKDGAVKFRAIELNEISGLYLKVIAPFREGDRDFGVGEELFITGKEQMIYFPRPEHAIIRYGKREVHYAVAIPAGEARYVLDRLSGKISLVRGPAMLLPDPRREVIVRRVLDPKIVELWFPGNAEAGEYNRRLMELTTQRRGERFVGDREARLLLDAEEGADKDDVAEEEVVEEFAGDKFTRHQSFTQPRTITLDTKYEGAVTINAWTGYAVLVVSKTGVRKVMVGPTTYLLEYDEILEATELSTGTPKSDDRLFKTVYLRVLHNKVSDIIEAETRDLCSVGVRLSYRVNFEGEPRLWFNVENYVKFLTDHMRSLLRYAIRQHGIEVFYRDAIQIIRDTILGLPDAEGVRTGRTFEENGMRIYDVEVLDVNIGDETIGMLMVDAQHNQVTQTLALATERHKLEVLRQTEEIKQQTALAQATTAKLALQIQLEGVTKQLELALARIEKEIATEQQALKGKLGHQLMLNELNSAELGREQARLDQELATAQRRLAQRIEELGAQVRAVVDRASAISPHMVSALQSFSDRALAERMAGSMAPLAILGGKSIADVLSGLLQGTVLEPVLARHAAAAEPVDQGPAPDVSQLEAGESDSDQQ